MARARSGGGPGLVWALVVFGTGFFLCLVLAIIFSTQAADAEKNEKEAREALDRFANKAQRSGQAVLDVQAEAGGETIVAYLIDQNDRLKQMILGDDTFDAGQIKEAKTKAGIDLSLMNMVEKLRQDITAMEGQVALAQKASKAADDRAAAAEAQAAKLGATYDSAKADLAADFTQTASKLDQAVTGYGDQQTTLRKEMGTLRSQMQEQIEQREARIEELSAELARQKLQIAKLIGDKVKVGVAADIVPADGAIVSLIADQDKVYIDRGAQDYIQLGMTFEVFNHDDLVKLDEYNELRGKATIEVIDMDDHTAVARIVRKGHKASLSPNDKVVNLIYDPDATYRFYVYGGFDIDNAGTSTARDRDRIKSMVNRWGGQVSDDLNWDVDFLVLGSEPPVPDPLDPDEIDPTVIRAHADASKNYETYQKLVTDARALSVPVLNQNRFLSLVGYYKR